MIQAKQELLAALGTVLQGLSQEAVDAGLVAAAPVAAFETPKQASHGDFACTAAMQLSKALKKNPRELATTLIAQLQAQPAFERWVDALEIAAPASSTSASSPWPSRPW